MSSQNSLDEVVAILRRLADLQLEYAEICEQKAQELYLDMQSQKLARETE
jgi:hypothetical protein